MPPAGDMAHGAPSANALAVAEERTGTVSMSSNNGGPSPWGTPGGGSGGNNGGGQRPPPGGGGPWGGGGGPGGPFGGRPGGPRPMPDVDQIIARIQAFIRSILGGGGGG